MSFLVTPAWATVSSFFEDNIAQPVTQPIGRVNAIWLLARSAVGVASLPDIDVSVAIRATVHMCLFAVFVTGVST
jgi:hypothetical protein